MPDFEVRPRTRAFPWRPHTETPVGEQTAIIATLDDTGEAWVLADTVWRWCPMLHEWQDEVFGAAIDSAEYYWLPESELLAGLEIPA